MPADANRVMLFLCGDVMTGRGADQILPHPSGQIFEPWVVGVPEIRQPGQPLSDCSLRQAACTTPQRLWESNYEAPFADAGRATTDGQRPRSPTGTLSQKERSRSDH